MMQDARFTPEQISALFTALSQRGITSLDQLAEVSSRTGGGVVADMESLGFAFAEVADEIKRPQIKLTRSTTTQRRTYTSTSRARSTIRRSKQSTRARSTRREFSRLRRLQRRPAPPGIETNRRSRGRSGSGFDAGNVDRRREPSRICRLGPRLERNNRQRRCAPRRRRQRA